MYYSESQRSPFLSNSGGVINDSAHSEATHREIDLEVKRLIDESYRTADETLQAQRETLDRLRADLVEMETMSAEHMQKVIAETRPAPRIMPGTSVVKSASSENPSRSDTPDESGDFEKPPRDAGKG